MINLNRNLYNYDIHINNNLYFVYYFNKNFISFFFNLNLQKKKFLILDNHYSYIYPLYKYIFGLNTLSLYKNFFFLKPVFFTRKNWSYFFLKFCKYNKINLLFISDFDYYSNFYKNLLEFDCSTSAIVPFNYSDSFIDYPLYTTYINILVKITYFSILSQIFFYSYNNINFFLKYQYFNNFYKYINTNFKN